MLHRVGNLKGAVEQLILISVDFPEVIQAHSRSTIYFGVEANGIEAQNSIDKIFLSCHLPCPSYWFAGGMVFPFNAECTLYSPCSLPNLVPSITT